MLPLVPSTVQRGALNWLGQGRGPHAKGEGKVGIQGGESLLSFSAMLFPTGVKPHLSLI